MAEEEEGRKGLLVSLKGKVDSWKMTFREI
jgi:hypothetical protein